jgi:acyl dehydratase
LTDHAPSDAHRAPSGTDRAPIDAERVLFDDVAALERAIGEPPLRSAWLTVTQAMIGEFAELTGDRQWIHLDVERARRESPYGTTIAHGFLTLSLLPQLIQGTLAFPFASASINYGFDRVRFLNAVPAGSAIRGVFALASVRRNAGGADLAWNVEVELRDAAKPALAATWLSRVLVRQA